MVHPIDTIKTRVQASNVSGVIFKGPADAMRQTFAREGFGAFYKGVIPVAGAVVPRVALQYTGLAFFKPRFEGSTYLNPGVAAGICTGIVQSVCVVTPLELLKQRQQTELSAKAGGEGRYQGSMATLRAVLRDEGVSGLYKGLSATMVRQCWGLSVKFYGYFTVKGLVQQVTQEREPQPWHGAVAGGLTNILVGVLVCPPDVVKVRMQNNGKAGTAREYKNVVDCVVQMATTEGPWAFFKGAGLRILRIAPGGMIQFYVAEWLAKHVFDIQIGGASK